jgi:hypothetical protein
VRTGRLQLSIRRRISAKHGPVFGRIGQRQANLLVWINDEDAAHADRRIGARMRHAVEVGDLAIGIGQDREVEGLALRFLDVTLPSLVAVGGIDGQAQWFDIALFPLGFQTRQFRGAQGGVVFWVAEQDAPAIAKIRMEAKLPDGAVLFEIRSNVSKLDGHWLGSP